MSSDNLAANFSRELADYIIYIIDVSGGDKIPRKGGPGITQADLLVCHASVASLLSSDYIAAFLISQLRLFYFFQVINKTDIAAAVGADLSVMERDALRMRDGGPFVFAQVFSTSRFIISGSQKLYYSHRREIMQIYHKFFRSRFITNFRFVMLICQTMIYHKLPFCGFAQNEVLICILNKINSYCCHVTRQSCV